MELTPDQKNMKLPIIKIDKLRINRDGKGVRTLVAVAECPINCKYCINDFCHHFPPEKNVFLTEEELFDAVKSHLLYYRATDGGITFGGGEPMLYADFILSFAQRYHKYFSICIETSLNVDVDCLTELAEYIDFFIVDVKDMNPDIYMKYTGMDNTQVLKNLRLLKPFCQMVLARVPLIPGYNSPEDIRQSRALLEEMGFVHHDIFTYITKE